jgi:hypothetical protein
VERAKLSQIKMGLGGEMRLSTEAIVESAIAMQRHVKLLSKDDSPTLAERFLAAHRLIERESQHPRQRQFSNLRAQVEEVSPDPDFRAVNE